MRLFNRKKKSLKKRYLFIGIAITVISLLLFVCSHLLQSKFGTTRQYWMGIEVSNLITDITLYLAIGLLIIMLMMWVNHYLDEFKRG